MSLQLELARLVVNILSDNSQFKRSIAEVRSEFNNLKGSLKFLTSLDTSSMTARQKHSLRAQIEEVRAAIRDTTLDIVAMNAKFISGVQQIEVGLKRVVNFAKDITNEYRKQYDWMLRTKNTMEAFGKSSGEAEAINEATRRLEDQYGLQRQSLRDAVAKIIQESGGRMSAEEAANLLETSMAVGRKRGVNGQDLAQQIAKIVGQEGLPGASGAARGLSGQYPAIFGYTRTLPEMMKRLQQDAANGGFKALSKDAETLTARFTKMGNKLYDLKIAFASTLGKPLISIFSTLIGWVADFAEWLGNVLTIINDSGWGPILSWGVALIGILGVLIVTLTVVIATFAILRSKLVGDAIFAIRETIGWLKALVVQKWAVVAANLAELASSPLTWGALAVATASIAGIVVAYKKMGDEASKSSDKVTKGLKQNADQAAKTKKQYDFKQGAGDFGISGLREVREKMLKQAIEIGMGRVGRKDPVRVAEEGVSEQRQTNRYLAQMARAERTAQRYGVPVPA